uniref:Putative ovule protein n=1 Tax=Solanum chacoense TaxID=4108 RepID=A0A0V0H7V6_SOLCH
MCMSRFSCHIGNTLISKFPRLGIVIEASILATSADYPKQGVTSGNKNKYLGWKTSGAKCNSPRCC